MINDIEALIVDFQSSVREAVQLFYDKYQRTDLLRALHEGVFPQSGQIANKRYSFHGIGLGIASRDKEVDFDFGPNDRIDGFDSWRLFIFANSQVRYVGVWTRERIDKELEVLFNSEKIYRPESYGNYYYKQLS